MKFTLNWLKEYVRLDHVSPEKLADDLTMLGLEVDCIEQLWENLAPLKTATVIKTEPHPNADKLTLCTVAVGEETLRIVCGAPNVRDNFCGVVALPGTTLPGNNKIKKSKVRGIESQGMLCSERELGLSDEHDGIMELPAETPHGQSFIDATGLRDLMIEVDLTPNRPDCASVIGIAREVAGIEKKKLHIPVKGQSLQTTSESFSVAIDAPDLCPRYGGRLIRQVKIGASPWWLRKRLLSVGLRPINNIVDVTNLVMLEYGQPLHAFDFDTLSDRKIIVRTPHENEKKFITLDGAERTLSPDMLMICDGHKPVAVAGVMGGLNSEVTDKTVNVLIESACFNPVSIRKTARALNLPSEASYRFERGVDPNGTIDAMERAVTLICQLTGGTAEPGGVDLYPGKKPLPVLTLRVSRTAALLGIKLSAEKICGLLSSIDLACNQKDQETITVTIPSFRPDLEREVDLIEEVARLVGYNEIPVSLPAVDLSYPEQERDRTIRNRARSFMTGIGFTEAINYSFYSHEYGTRLALAESDPRNSPIRILNPLSEDQDVMRTTLLPGLLENVRRNINFQQDGCRLFEMGNVFFPVDKEELASETTRLAGILYGKRHGGKLPYHFSNETIDIYDAKGAVESLLTEMRLTGSQSEHVTLVPADESEPFAVPAYAMQVLQGSRLLGTIGKLKEEILRHFGIKRDIYYFDLDFAALCQITPTPKHFSPLPVYPSVKRDVALIIPENTAAGELVETILNSREKLVEQCDVFDVFHGKKIEKGFKSVALSITYRSATKTLTEKNVEKVHTKLVKTLTSRFGGSFREA
ncbi:MAG: phenylalanine--tRNA ligase subunit beta [Proteobacteria bacterium]|nr:MAG: phenylalanine--tRNA ligase subunit beta [Pseudomonadota bacterium]